MKAAILFTFGFSTFILVLLGMVYIGFIQWMDKIKEHNQAKERNKSYVRKKR